MNYFVLVFYYPAGKLHVKNERPLAAPLLVKNIFFKFPLFYFIILSYPIRI